jgi:adenylate kinase
MKVVVLLGAPGAGKGTQAPLLADHLGIPAVATGDLFRAAVRDQSPLGAQAKSYMDAGRLVPDEITIGLLLDRLGQPDAARGVILDGFPRTRVQAQVLDAALADRDSAVAVAVLVEVPADELVRRLSGRWICRAAGHPYHEVSSPPLVAGRCDIDGSELYQRSDDQPETVKARLSQQLGVLGEVVEYYRRLGVLVTVDGSQPIEKVAEDLLAGMEKTLGGKD